MKLNKITIPKDVVLLCALAVVLSLLRVMFFHTFSALYILWNIFLALVPFCVSYLLLVRTQEGKLAKWQMIAGGVIWLLLIPNAPYIVTDLIHITRMRPVPIIFDTFMFFTSAWVGVLLWCYSLSHIEQVIRTRLSHRTTLIVLMIISLITSFGIYLGRFLRFNSWDVVANPVMLYGGVRNTLQPGANEAFSFIVLSTLFIYISYWAWKYAKINN
ncbi:MAG: DUF1361 domain-containing protein [bacterium]